MPSPVMERLWCAKAFAVALSVAQPLLELLRFIKIYDHVVITLPAPEKKCPMDSSPRGVHTVQFLNVAHL